MRETYELDMTPYDEPCAQVGDEAYRENVRLEFAAIKAQLIRMFGEPPAGAYLKSQSAPHDFGTYYELAVVYNDESEEASEYVSRVENDFPASWDAEAKAFLQSHGYHLNDGEHTGAVKLVLSSLRKETRKLASMKRADIEDFTQDAPAEETEDSFLVSKTYEVVTPESAEDGDFADNGFVFEDEVMDRSDVVRELRRGGYIHPSSSSLQMLRWVSTEEEQDYSDGSYTSYSLHIQALAGPEIDADTWKSLLEEAGLLSGMHLSAVKLADALEEKRTYNTWTSEAQHPESMDPGAFTKSITRPQPGSFQNSSSEIGDPGDEEIAPPNQFTFD